MKDFEVKLGEGVVLRGQEFMQDKLLLLATSRYGKSKQCRNIAEQCGKIMPIFVFDHEGEFKNLRSYIPIVIAGPDGEVPARVETASKLARRLVESNLSAVLDISELALEEKRHFMCNFLVAMTELPRSLWGPRLMMFDEFQEYCPQVGDADGARQIMNRYMALCGKRGHGVVAATHRISKAHKDSIAIFTNVCVGRCTLDTDVRRARELLDFGKDRSTEIKTLLRGEFFALGPSFEHEGVKRFRGQETQTHHPTTVAEKHTLKPPPPSATILKFARELQDLQKEADEEKSELETLRERVRTLEAEKAKRDIAPPAPEIDVEVYKTEVEQHVREQILAAIDQQISALHEDLGQVTAAAKGIAAEIEALGTLHESARSLVAEIEALSAHATKLRQKAEVDTVVIPIRTKTTDRLGAIRQGPTTESARVHAPRTTARSSDDAERRILSALAQHSDGLDRTTLALIAQISPTSSAFSTKLAKLRAEGKISASSPIKITSVGLRSLGPYNALPTGRALVQYWVEWLGDSEGRMLQAAIRAGKRGLSKEALCAASGVSPTSSSASTKIAKLRKLRLLEQNSPIRASAQILEAAGQ